MNYSVQKSSYGQLDQVSNRVLLFSIHVGVEESTWITLGKFLSYE